MHQFNNIKYSYTPFPFMQSTIKIALAKSNNNSYLASIVDKKDITNSNKELLDIVLIIGETATLYHQEYHGYKRNTNEFTKKIKNIIYFNNATSCWTTTAYSVPCILSMQPQKKFMKHYPPSEHNIAEVFNKAGFTTHWIGVAGVMGRTVRKKILFDFKNVIYDETIPKIVNDSASLDMRLLKLYDLAFKERINNSKYNFIVFHGHGSHYPYKKHYPESFKYYSNQEEIDDNDYDNALRYTDYVYSEIIKLFKNRKALVLYFADHGESLLSDHNGFTLHAAPYDKAPKEQTHIAAWAWASDKWLKDPNNARKYKLIKEKANKSISHDWVFHSLIDCADIKINSNLVDKKLSLCR